MLTDTSSIAVGVTWNPKLPSFTTAASSSSSCRAVKLNESSVLYKPASELIDGLFLPPRDPKQLNKLLRAQIKDTSGKHWYDMPAPVMTPELKNDLQLLKLRGAMDPKRHYKKSDTKSKTLPKYFQVGTVVEPASEYYSSRLTNKERKSSLTDELLHDPSLTQYRKRKVREIEAQNQPGGNKNWKNKGKQTLKRAKEKRHISESRYIPSKKGKKRFKRI